MMSKVDSGSRVGTVYRVREELELPKISKTFPLENQSLSEKYQWLIVDKDYDSLSMMEIEQEYQQLRKQLLLINEEAGRNVDRINMKPMKKSRVETVERLVEIRDKEIENNCAIIARLKYEYEQLQKRAGQIEATGKDELDSSIAEGKDQIVKLRLKIKQLKFKSKQIGDSIQNGDQVFNEIQMLERDRQLAERKKAKLLERDNEFRANYERIMSSLQQISGSSQLAQNFIEEHMQSSRHIEDEKKLESTFKQKSSQLQIVKKNCESIKNSKQQRYHILLRQLQGMNIKVNQDDHLINHKEQANLNTKKQIAQLQLTLQQIIRKTQMRSTINQRQIPRDAATERDEKESNLKIVSKDPIENIKKKLGLAIKKSPSPLKVNKNTSEFSANVLKLEQIRGEKTHYSGRKTNKQQTQLVYNKTYAKMGQPLPETTSASLKVSTEFTAKQTLEIHEKQAATALSKYAVSAKLNQIPKQIPKSLHKASNFTQNAVLGAENTQKNGPVNLEQKNTMKITKDKGNQAVVKSVQKDQVPKQSAKVYLQNSDLKSQHNNEISQELPQGVQADQLKIGSQQLQIRKQKEGYRYESEQEDEDLEAFRQSINLEKENIASGKMKFEITLADIQSSIRKSESLSRLKKLNDNLNGDTIQEEMPN